VQCSSSTDVLAELHSLAMVKVSSLAAAVQATTFPLEEGSDASDAPEHTTWRTGPVLVDSDRVHCKQSCVIHAGCRLGTVSS